MSRLASGMFVFQILVASSVKPLWWCYMIRSWIGKLAGLSIETWQILYRWHSIMIIIMIFPKTLSTRQFCKEILCWLGLHDTWQMIICYPWHWRPFFWYKYYLIHDNWSQELDSHSLTHTFLLHSLIQLQYHNMVFPKFRSLLFLVLTGPILAVLSAPYMLVPSSLIIFIIR